MNFSFGLTNTPKGAGDAGNPASNNAAPKTLFGQTPTTTAPTFSFGSPAASTAAPSFGFGASPAQQATPGNPAASTPAPSFGFGASPAQQPTPGTTATSTAPTFGISQQPAQGFTFGATPKTTSSTLSFGAPQTTTQSTTSFGLLSNTASTAGFSLSTTSAAATTSAPTAGINFGFGDKTTTTAPTTTTSSFSFGSTPKTTASTLSFGSLTATTTTASSTSLPTFGATVLPTCASTTTTTSATGFAGVGLNLGSSLSAPKSTAASAVSTGFSLATTTTASMIGGFGTSVVSTSSGAVTTTVMSGAPTAANASMNFTQLEENINKWTLDLEEQEKIFMSQATQINAWDQLLIENTDKILILNDNIEKIKTDQFSLDHELDFIVGQQNELEDMIAPLERELSQVSIRDPEREQSYQLAENLDTQLKQMTEDLKEVIEHLNESNKVQDNNDPIVQIGKILNAHMSSLQWIDANTAQINAKLQQVERMQETLRSSTERAFHRTFD